jgi:hypothetical protein
LCRQLVFLNPREVTRHMHHLYIAKFSTALWLAVQVWANFCLGKIERFDWSSYYNCSLSKFFISTNGCAV